MARPGRRRSQNGHSGRVPAARGDVQRSPSARRTAATAVGVQPKSSVRKRYTSAGCRALTEWTTVIGLKGTSYCLEKPGRPVDLVEGRRSAFAFAKLVVQVLGAVDAQAHVEAVLLEELAPRVVQEHAVGLQVVLDALGACVLPL